MSRPSRILLVTIAVLFVLACNLVSQPIKDAENLKETAQALGTVIPIQTLEALPSVLPSVIPAETLQALPSMAPSLEALATDFGNLLNPQGTPAQEWKGVPIMPQATAGQEFTENNTYSFKATATLKDVQDFYNNKMPALGWTQPFSAPNGSDAAIMFFHKENTTLTITITASDNAVVVLLTMA
ncbi:MAG TPA: hypothetical protein VK249_32695 [Anaerolineales bacterium]|nr:hypothetical protein [Anaerolineales bacterium]